MLKATINTKLDMDYAGEEAMNTVCSNLIFAGRNIRKVVMTSCEANDGKSFVTIQAAVNMAKRGKKVILVDADLRKSVLNTVYDIRLEGQKMGLTHFLVGQCSIEDCVYQTNIANLYLMPVGKTVGSSLSLLSAPEFNELMDNLAKTFDLVLLDTPPVGLVVDAAEIARCCDGSVMVLEYNKTGKKELNQAKIQMQQSGCPVLGCILNKVVFDRLSTRKYYSQYSSKYKYGYKRGEYSYYGKKDKENKE